MEFAFQAQISEIQVASQHLPGDLRSLTSLRFFAALWVVLLHFRDQLPFDFSAHNPINHGTRAVDFFFILSGFILAHVYGPQLQAGRFRMKDFVVKRLARLYPVHFVTLLASLAIFLLATALHMKLNNAEKYDLAQFVPNLLMIQAWFPFTRAAFNMPSWSISAEFAAYLLFPLMAGLVLKSQRSGWFWLLVAAAVLAAMVTVVQLVWHVELLRLITLGVFRIIPLFFLGIVLWKGWAERIFVIPAWLMLPSAIGVMLLAWVSVAVVPLFGIIILAGAEMETEGRSRWLAAPWLVFLGEASYSLYMTHDLVQTVFFAALQKLHLFTGNSVLEIAGFFVGILISILVSLLTYQWIEAPCRGWLTARFAARKPVVAMSVA